MNSKIYLMAAFVFKITASQKLSHSTLLGTEQSLTLTCETDDLSKAILFKLGNDNKGGCIGVGSCDTAIPGYEKPTQQGTTITEMVITSCNETRDIGNWTCTYGGSTSEPVMITTCSKGTNTNTDNDNSGSEGTNTKTDNDNSDGQDIGIAILTAICVIVIVMVAKCLSTWSTGETYWLLGFVYLVLCGVIVEVIVLLAVYYGFAEFQVGLVIGVGFVIVLVLSGLCLLVVWMLKKFFNNEKSKCEEKPENSKIMMTEKVTT